MNTECRLELLPIETRQKVKSSITVLGTTEELALIVDTETTLSFELLDNQDVITYIGNVHIIDSYSYVVDDIVVGKTFTLQADDVTIAVGV